MKLSLAQDQGLQIWQTKSKAIVVNDHVPADCIYRVTSQNGGEIQYERMPTARSAPKVILKSRWRNESEQYSGSASSDAWKDWKGTQDVSDFQIDLRIPGVPDDVVQQDENRTKEINEILEKLRIG